MLEVPSAPEGSRAPEQVSGHCFYYPSPSPPAVPRSAPKQLPRGLCLLHRTTGGTEYLQANGLKGRWSLEHVCLQRGGSVWSPESPTAPTLVASSSGFSPPHAPRDSLVVPLGSILALACQLPALQPRLPRGAGWRDLGLSGLVWGAFRPFVLRARICVGVQGSAFARCIMVTLTVHLENTGVPRLWTFAKFCLIQPCSPGGLSHRTLGTSCLLTAGDVIGETQLSTPNPAFGCRPPLWPACASGVLLKLCFCRPPSCPDPPRGSPSSPQKYPL